MIITSRTDKGIMAEKRGRYIIDFRDIPSERQGMPELEVEKRKDNFEEVELGLSLEAAREEARRCLSCRRCLGCELCLAVCEPKAIVFDQEDEIIDLAVDEIIISAEVKTHIPPDAGEFAYLKFINVVSVFEFERILSEDGPYGGMLLRAFDGELPEKIGFIIDNNMNGEKDDGHLLSYAMQEAALAMTKVEDLNVSFFVSETIDVENISNEAEKKGVHIKKGKVLGVKEVENTGNLMVTFMEDGNEKEEEFEMLIVSKPPAMPGNS